MASEIQNLSVTTGSAAADIAVSNRQISMELNRTHIDLSAQLGTIDNNITIVGGGVIGSGYLDVRVDVTGVGSDAEIEAILDENGSITGFNVTKPGFGYTADTNLTIVPIIRAIGYGVPAEIRRSTDEDFNVTTGQNDFVSHARQYDFNGTQEEGLYHCTNLSDDRPGWRRMELALEWSEFEPLAARRVKFISHKCGPVSIGPIDQQMSSHVCERFAHNWYLILK